MKNAVKGNPLPVDKVRTTIGVKLATKHLILNRSLPGENLEDTILRLIHERDGIEEEFSVLKKTLEKRGIKEPNLLITAELSRGNEGIELDDGTLINFTYNIPIGVSPNLIRYQMDIVVEDVIKQGKKYTFDELPLSEKDRILLYFSIVEKVINLHFDSGFKLSEKKFLIDQRYWKKIFSRVGLPDSSYFNDMIKIIQHYESGQSG